MIGHADQLNIRGVLPVLLLAALPSGALALPLPAAPVSSPAAAVGPAVNLRVVPDRLVYLPDQLGTVRVLIQNREKIPIQGRLVLRVTSGLASERVLGKQAVELAPGLGSWTFPYRAYGDEGGREFDVTLTTTSGKEVDAREYSLVAHNLVSLGQLGIARDPIRPGNPDPGGAQMQSFVQDTLRAHYDSLMEMPGWAPDDFSLLAPTMDAWRSGQSFDYFNRSELQSLVSAAKGEGIWPLCSTSRWASGPAGYEFARKHPDWVYWGSDWYGGSFDVRQLKAWQTVGGSAAAPGPVSITPLLGKPAVAAFGIDQIVQSLKMFGWNGVCMDNGGWQIGGPAEDSFGGSAYPADLNLDQGNADLVQRIRRAGEGVNPQFVYADCGDGLQPAMDLQTAAQKWRAEAARGGLVLDSGFGDWLHGFGGNWADFRRYLYNGCLGTRRAGGYPYVLGLTSGSPVVESPADMKTVLACALASGAHLADPSEAVSPVVMDYVRFSVRWSELLYDADLEWVADPGALLSVSSARPLWWREYVRRRVTGPGEQELIVHLINPPRHDDYNAARARTDRPEVGRPAEFALPDPDGKWAYPAPVQSDVKVTFNPPPGIYVEKAFALTPDGGLHSERLGLLRQGTSVTATIPRLCYWTVLVFQARDRD